MGKSKLFVVGILFLVIAVTSPHDIKRFWRNAGDFFQTRWENLLDNVGEDPVTLWVYGPMVVMLIVYWGEGMLYILMDVTNTPAFLRKYKIQPGTNEPADGRKLTKAILTVLFCQTLVTYPIAHTILWWMELRGHPQFRQLPALHNLLVDIGVSVIVGEIAFYYVHRLLHHKALYKYFHKQHHEWTSPISIVALYCNPLEYIMANMATLNLGYMLWGSHVFSVYVFYIVGITKTLNSHCGYNFPFNINRADFHDYHHVYFNECFGLIGVLDRIHGTDKKFREDVKLKQRSRMLFSVN